MKSVPAIAFDYRPSRWLLVAIIAIALLALVAIALCGLNAWSRLVLAMIVIVYATWAMRDFRNPSFIHISWHAAGHWRLRDTADREQVAELQRAVVLGMLIVLVLRIGPQRLFALPLLPDNCDAETRRRLRVRLARADSIGVE